MIAAATAAQRSPVAQALLPVPLFNRPKRYTAGLPMLRSVAGIS